MFYALSWSVVLILLALWSLAAWAFHAIATWTVSHSGSLVGGAGAIEGLRAPDWLAPWIPPELALAFSSTLSAFVPAIEAAVNQVPALASVLSAAIWLVWGLGAALIVVLGLVCSAFIAVLRRRASVFAMHPTGPATAS